MSSRSGFALREYCVQRIIRASFISALIRGTSGAKQRARETVRSALGCENNRCHLEVVLLLRTTVYSVVYVPALSVTSGSKQRLRETVRSALGCEKNRFVVSKRCSFTLLCSLY